MARGSLSGIESAPVTTLRGISEIRGFFRTNETPIYFVSPTAFNLLGIDRWVRDFFYVNYFDSFEGNHPRVIVPKDRPYQEFDSIEEICNYLLRHREMLELFRSRGPGGKVVFVFFDEETEACAAEAGLEVVLPSAELRRRLDSKIVTTQLGDEAGVPSVPNVLGRARATGSCWSWPGERGWATTWWCRPRTATRARPRSSFATRRTGTRTPRT